MRRFGMTKWDRCSLSNQGLLEKESPQCSARKRVSRATEEEVFLESYIPCSDATSLRSRYANRAFMHVRVRGVPKKADRISISGVERLDADIRQSDRMTGNARVSDPALSVT